MAIFCRNAAALVAPTLNEEAPSIAEFEDNDNLFYFHLSVLPHEGGDRRLRFRVFQDWLDDGAPYRADIRFKLSPTEAEAFSNKLQAWCAKPEYAFVWKGD